MRQTPSDSPPQADPLARQLSRGTAVPAYISLGRRDCAAVLAFTALTSALRGRIGGGSGREVGASKGAAPADQTVRQSYHDSGGCRSGESSRRNSGGSTSRAESTRSLSGSSPAAFRAQRISATEGRLVVQDSASPGCLPSPRGAGKDSRPGAPQSAGERAREQRRQQGRAMEALHEERPAGGGFGAKLVASGSVGAAHKLALGALQRKIGTSGAAVRYPSLPHHLR